MKQFSKACQRNREPIAEVLDDVLPDSGRILEVGSGTGQHAAYFARRFPKRQWQPTDRPGHLASINAWRRDSEAQNLCAPRPFDLFDDTLPVDSADGLVAINVIHIAPAAAIERLFHHASLLLSDGDPVVLYGPYRYRERPLEPSNQRFDRHLQQRSPESGLRLFANVDDTAAEYGFQHVETRRLPANNDIHWWVRDH